MLSKEEELRVASFIDATKHDIEKDMTYASEFYVSSVLWLAEKLKETNDELSKVHLELEKTNKALAYVLEGYGP